MRQMSSQDFAHIYRNSQVPWIAQVAVALLVALATLIVASPVDGGLPTLVLLVAFVAVVAIWWVFLRARGFRGNDYDPMQTDAEAARTPFSWKEEGRFLLMLIVVMAPMQFSQVMASWPFAWGAAGLALAVSLWVIRYDAWRPHHYLPPRELAASAGRPITGAGEWLACYLYALRVAPGGRQIRSDVLAERLESYGWSGSEVSEALSGLVASGKAVRLRELRSSDGAVTWVTLTKEGREAAKAGLGGRP
ncbi:MAG TPA: hypothetical protein H9867_09980 [Candidatus Corynebacterium gallistercoris]|uniref:Uncharacterized protein n=1 Tax=Candidatus Corynebacterium gallistercoris TaxID=2838530 RepID=A0A9D1RYA9_9CORY|nr:hypothetical protein [Candidatus Corynebacterium gallistercoris]